MFMFKQMKCSRACGETGVRTKTISHCLTIAISREKVLCSHHRIASCNPIRMFSRSLSLSLVRLLSTITYWIAGRSVILWKICGVRMRVVPESINTATYRIIGLAGAIHFIFLSLNWFFCFVSTSVYFCRTMKKKTEFSFSNEWMNVVRRPCKLLRKMNNDFLLTA